MNYGRTLLLVLVAAGLLAWSPASFAQDVKRTNDIAVVVNSTNPIDNLSLSDLGKILRGDRRFWNNKVAVVMVLRPAGAPDREHVLSAAAHMNDTEFKEHWIGKVFRGEAPSEPLTVPSHGLASEFVSTNAGALSFMPGTDVRADLKVLKIDGRLPGQAGYPLK
jgi:hypothetical protein